MMEVRFHGRGGQGAVTSAEVLAQAAIREGRFAQAFPSFGPERRGAPVVAYARISDQQIRNRTAIDRPDVVVVLDPSILKIVNVAEGLKEGGVIVVNSGRTSAELKKEFKLPGRLAVVNANHIAREEIGRVITNTTMLGALIKATGLVGVDKLHDALNERFGRIATKNVKAFNRALAECCVA